MTQDREPWRGWWEEPGGRKEHMTLQLSLRNGHITGSGEDVVGRFTINGSVTDGGSVGFSKAYGTHAVQYSGVLSGKAIAGTWTVWGLRSGPFRIWREGLSAAEETSTSKAEVLLQSQDTHSGGPHGRSAGTEAPVTRRLR